MKLPINHVCIQETMKTKRKESNSSQLPIPEHTTEAEEDETLKVTPPPGHEEPVLSESNSVEKKHILTSISQKFHPFLPLLRIFRKMQVTLASISANPKSAKNSNKAENAGTINNSGVWPTRIDDKRNRSLFIEKNSRSN